MANEQWHLDRKVPVAIIFAIVVQSMGGVWWAASISERTEQIERRMEDAATRAQVADAQIATMQRDIAVVVSQLADTTRQLERLYGELTMMNGLIREYFDDRRDGGPRQ